MWRNFFAKLYIHYHWNRDLYVGIQSFSNTNPNSTQLLQENQNVYHVNVWEHFLVSCKYFSNISYKNQLDSAKHVSRYTVFSTGFSGFYKYKKIMVQFLLFLTFKISKLPSESLRSCLTCLITMEIEGKCKTWLGYTEGRRISKKEYLLAL